MGFFIISFFIILNIGVIYDYKRDRKLYSIAGQLYIVSLLVLNTFIFPNINSFLNDLIMGGMFVSVLIIIYLQIKDRFKLI
ncbi:hypothetical protein CLPU_1c02020 [Gottschalkia purinilytica]|uniref:Uncharacterized protein n=1 Tax=Gottschalkia purinilytica TaxID=1503 RepID=A0A0L0WEX8_GOTPU|nr:hypothetical protein CLPU_1c02020 [Gottschalkia purinilytica]